MALVLTAFEWKFYDSEGTLNNTAMIGDSFEEMLDVPPTEQPPPPPPETKNINLVAIEDTEEIEDELEISFDIEMTEDMKIEQLPDNVDVEDVVEDESAEEIFVIVEEQPHPIGGMQSFYDYINSHIRYPSSARRMNIEGRVFVQFVVERDGSISQVQAIRGITESCDNEAIRVVSNAPAWKPGKQRGKPVRVKMVLPITFKLQ
jgi:protein TonB